MAKNTISFTSTVIRHHPQFSRLVTIPLKTIAPWKLQGTTVIEGTINGMSLGRRTIKRWDDRECWWIDLPETLCKKAKIDTGDEERVTISLAVEEMPEELNQLLITNKLAQARWEKLTEAQRRMARENVLAAKSSATRVRRAAAALSLEIKLDSHLK